MAQRKRDTTLDDEKASQHVTALCNQPEAFASDRSDDKSRYLLLWDQTDQGQKWSDLFPANFMYSLPTFSTQLGGLLQCYKTRF